MRAIALATAAAATLVIVYLALGGASYSPAKVADPCMPRALRNPQGVGEVAEQVVLSAIDGAACKLGTSREDLILSLEPRSDFGPEVTWTRATLEDALRAGLVRAIEDADHRNAIPGFVATGMKFLAERAPIDWILGRVNIPFLES